MATPAAYLSVVVEATTAGATRNLRAVQTELQHTGKGATLVEGNSKRMSGALNESGKSASRAHSSFSSLAKGVLAAGGAFAAFELAKSAITDTEALVAATIKLTAATGLDAKTASSWIEAMKARGVESTAVSLGFITLEHNIRNAEGGSKSAMLAFQQLGVPMSDIKKQNLQQTVLEIADAFQKSADPTLRAAIAQQLFGRNAKVLIPILAQGSQGIKEMLAAAERYGAFLPKNIKQLKQAHDAQLNLNLAMDGLKIAFTRAVLPALVDGAKHLLTFISQMRQGKGAGGQFASVISTGFNTIKTVVKTVTGLFGGLGNTLKVLAGLWAASKVLRFASALSNVVSMVKGLGSLGKAGVLGGLTLGVGLLISKLLSLPGISREVATTSHDVAKAWRDEASAARMLNRTNLDLAQAKLDEARATRAQQQAQEAVNSALRKSGRTSTQYKTAAAALAQTNIDLKNSQLAVRDAVDAQDAASLKNFTATQKGIAADETRTQTLWGVIVNLRRIHASTDQVNAAQKAYNASVGRYTGDLKKLLTTEWARVNTLSFEYLAMKKAGATTDELKHKHDQLTEAVKNSASIQDALNTALRNQPKSVSTNIGIATKFTSNPPKIIESIGSAVFSFAKVLGFARGGVVNQPGYFAGEEAPCIAEGTLIETADGPQPIEAVSIGEFVLTRNGYRRVLWSGPTRLNTTVLRVSTISREDVVCTPDHRFWSLNGEQVRDGVGGRLVRGRGINACPPRSAGWQGVDAFSIDDGSRCRGAVPQHRGSGSCERSAGSWTEQEADLSLEQRGAGRCEADPHEPFALVGRAANGEGDGGAGEHRCKERGRKATQNVLQTWSSPHSGEHVHVHERLSRVPDLQTGHCARGDSSPAYGSSGQGARTETGTRVSASQEQHPSISMAVWREASELTAGDLVWVLGDDGLEPTQVDSVERIDHRVDTYDLMVEGDHEFIAGGILVHNSHPEVILATNPAHRQRNLQLWAQAGRMLGVAGFAQGGITPADVVKQIVPGTVKMAENWVGRASQAYFSLPGVLHAAGFQAGGIYQPASGEPGHWSMGNSLGVSSTTNNITINVTRDADIGKVADVIDRTTGSHLHARLRSAGLRGT